MKKYLYTTLLLLLGAVAEVFPQSMIITGGNDHGIALCNKGQIFAWGYNDGNRLCLSDPADKNKSIVPYPSLVNTGNLTFSQLSGGSGGHSVALSCYKIVYCWGANKEMQCGRPASAYITGGEPVPVYKGVTEIGYNLDGSPGGDYLGNVKYISATTRASMAILDDGTGRVVVWGTNDIWGTPTSEPIWLEDESGRPIRNVIHITGGDDNIMLIVGDSPDALVGTVYSSGNWNGRGAQATALDNYAAPVEIGDGTGKASSGEYLTNVRNAGVSDVGGFAVDGTTGYVYGWGNGGWGCSNGLANNNSNKYAEKVISGEYKAISGEPYLTNVKQVIGGNGNGTAVTEDGYVLYWGSNEAAKTSSNKGGVIPNSSYAAQSDLCKVGPVFANYCAGEKGAKEVRVDDAVAIARGDLYGFMVNSEGDFYVWGSTARPGTETPMHVGALGIGEETYVSTCFKKIDIDCTPQDLCPEVFMVPSRYKCPGEKLELYCGFTPAVGREDNYYFFWEKDGVPLNTSTKTSSDADRSADVYNKHEIEIDEGGVYKVTVSYVGLNVPCDNCPDVSAEIEIIDMAMPIDTFITEMNCVSDVDNLTDKDQVCYEAVVNDKFYKATDKVTFAVFSTENSTDTLEVIETTGGGEGKIEFCVSGDKVGKVNDNALTSKDTTFSVWVEDITSFETYLLKDEPLTAGGNDQKQGLLFEIFSMAHLQSFEVAAKTYYGPGTFTAKPQIYSVDVNDLGNPVKGSLYWEGDEQTFDITDVVSTHTVKCDVKLPANTARGTRYVLAVVLSGSGYQPMQMTLDVTQPNNAALFSSPILDSESFGISAVGSLEGTNPGKTSLMTNIKFGKLTDYDCGRIELQARYGCPPCNMPTGNKVTIESTTKLVANAEGVKTVALCNDSDPITLSVKDVVKEGAKFDILWYAESLSSTAVLVDSEKSASSYPEEISWKEDLAGKEVKYYVQVRDNEKPTASTCFVYDSVIVIYNEIPKAPAIEIEPFCESLDGSEKTWLTEILSGTDFDGYGVNWYADSKMSATATAPVLADLAAVKAGDPLHKFYYSVTSEVTGCESPVDSFEVDVQAVDKPTGALSISYLKSDAVDGKFKDLLAQAAAKGIGLVDEVEGLTLQWYDENGEETSSVPTPEFPDASVTDDIKKTYYVSYKNELGCESDTVSVQVTIFLTPAPTVTPVHYCVNSPNPPALTADINSPNGGTYTLKWYDKDGKTTLSAAPKPDVSTVGMNILQAYVSQVSSDGAESSLVPVYVNVYGVKEPALDVANVYEYCASNQMATALKATAADDEKNGYYSSEIVWKQDVKGTYSKLTSNPTPSLDVKKDTVYKYRLYQEYTIASTGEVCKGDSIETEVSVTYVPEVVTSEVLYLKADAVGGEFANDLLTQDANAVKDQSGAKVDASSLQWYKADCTTPLDKAPTPSLDPNVPEGDDQTLSYCVSKRVKVSDDLECLSKPVTIDVRISDALPPSIYHYYYCEGQVMEDLEATINPQANKTNADYELYWYKEKPTSKEEKANPDYKGLGTALAYPMNTEAASVKDGKVTVYPYYVAQYDTKSEAISSVQEVTVTVYPKPEVTITDPAAVCEEEVDLSATVDVSNKGVLTDVTDFIYTYYNGTEAAPIDMKKSVVGESNTYYIDAKFDLPIPSKDNVKYTDKVCQGMVKPVKVVINTLTIPVITGEHSTCPGTSVTLTASATSTDPKTVTYTWGGSADTTAGATEKEGDDTFVTKNLSTVTGVSYSYNVTAKAGVCEKKSEYDHVVTIGDGKVEGSMMLTEEGNDELKNGMVFLNDDPKTIAYSCGKPVTITVQYEGDQDFVWYKNGQKVGMGSSYTTEAYATSTEDIYTVKYTNVCPTSSSVEIHVIPIKASPLSVESIEMCEGEKFETGLKFDENLKAGVTPGINWYRDGSLLGGETAKTLIIEDTKKSDSGQYSYEVFNRGCKDSSKVNFLKVKPYIKARMSQQEPYIVDRHQTQTLPITYEYPTTYAITSQKWYEEGNSEPVFDGNPYVLENVEKDHRYEIVLSDPDYCSDTLSAIVYVDALLQLKTTLKDTMCLGTDEILEIDTTGTGTFRRPNGNPQLNIFEVVGDENPLNINNKIVKVGDKLQLKVSPRLDAKYEISFKYNGQNEDSEEKIVVIPAISLTVPEIPNICSGTETLLTVTNVQPVGTSVTWTDDPTIIEGKNSETVRVKPVFKAEGSSNHQYRYNYNVIAYNSICDNSKPYTVTVLVDEPLVGDIIGDLEICEGEETLLDAESYLASQYKWLPDTIGNLTTSKIIVRPVVSTQYTVDMSRGLCTASDTFTVNVNSNPRIEKIDSVALRDRLIVLEAGYGTGPFMYQIDSKDFDGMDLKTDLAFAKHVVNVRDSKGCMTSTVFNLDPPEISIPIVFTPNGDGVNDTWSIPAIAEVYPNSVVSIYDRFGKLLVQFLGAEAEGWDGTYQGNKLPSTDYWYQITIEEIDKEYSGHFTLIRR
jgi:gliding motility-associated-like protein